MIKVYKDWVIVADDNQYKLGTLIQTKDKETGETGEVVKTEHYVASIEQALKVILRVEKRRLTQAETMTLEEAYDKFEKLTADFASKIPHFG